MEQLFANFGSFFLAGGRAGGKGAGERVWAGDFLGFWGVQRGGKFDWGRNFCWRYNRDSRCQGFSGSGVWLIGRGRGASRRVEDEGAFVVEANFRGDPVGGEDVFWVNRLWIGVVGGDPFANGGPGRIDRLKGVDVERGSGGGGMLMRPSQSPWSRRKNSTASGRLMDSMRRREPRPHGHWRGSVAQTDWIRSRQRGRMARAVVFSGVGMRRIWTAVAGGFSAGGFLVRGGGTTTGCAGRGQPRERLEYSP